jgi:hypothetical protein
VCSARAWMDEMNGERGRKFSAGGRWLCFKGSTGEGARRGGRLMEVEREREREGALGTVLRSASARQQPGRGACGRRGRRDADGVADRWAGTRQGARSSMAGCNVRQQGEAVGAALTGGADTTVRPIRFSN